MKPVTLLVIGSAVLVALVVPRLACATIRKERTKTWCESLVPRLDEWRVQHGEYPAQLEELGPDVILPPRLGYHSYGSSFIFDVPDILELKSFPTGQSWSS